MDADGVLYVDGAAHGADGIRGVLETIRNPGEVTVTVAADERTPHRRVREPAFCVSTSSLPRPGDGSPGR